MARAISVNQLAVLAYTAPSPDMDHRFGIEFLGRQLDHRREYVGFRIRIHSGPGRLAAEMRFGEVPFAPGIEQVLDSVEVEKERVASAAGEISVGARLDDMGRGAEGDLGIGDDLCSYGFRRSRLRALRHEYADRLPAIPRLREHITERHVRQVIIVVINIEAID